MGDQTFIQSIIETASKLKGASITTDEQEAILNEFNKIQGSAFERARKAIEIVIGQKIPEERTILEKSASLNNLQNLLIKLKAVANEWQKEKK